MQRGRETSRRSFATTDSLQCHTGGSALNAMHTGKAGALLERKPISGDQETEGQTDHADGNKKGGGQEGHTLTDLTVTVMHSGYVYQTSHQTPKYIRTFVNDTSVKCGGRRDKDTFRVDSIMIGNSVSGIQVKWAEVWSLGYV